MFACDVIFDPQRDHQAHANIVVFDKGPDEILTVTNTLLENLTWVTPAQIAAIQYWLPSNELGMV